MTRHWTVFPPKYVKDILKVHGDNLCECGGCGKMWCLRELSVDMDRGGIVFRCPEDGSILATEDDFDEV